MEFPYLQSARAIYLKGLYNRDSFRYNSELKKTAAYTTDRAVLFDFITTEDFRSIDRHVLEEQNKALAQIEVTESVEIKNNIASLPTVDKLEQSIKLLIKEAEEETPVTAETEKFAVTQTEEAIDVPITEPSFTALAKEQSVVEITDQPELAVKPIGSPLEFKENETHSFAEWLQLSKLKPIERENTQPEPAINEELDKKYELIDKFIEANPKIIPVKKDAPPVANLAKTQSDSPGIMTETLARVYLEQKKYTKAIQAYEILILKYPEKSVFFADRILEVKNLQQNINKEQ
ncbi:tetratricopeptide repeat protein [Flavobacterium sp. Sd200]|uniref:tetratricopeptide repeat protein n=1 Tax=Flavobacterium sp. Sd200 TaxID=2692211 RepID=UPI00351B6503